MSAFKSAVSKILIATIPTIIEIYCELKFDYTAKNTDISFTKQRLGKSFKFLCYKFKMGLLGRAFFKMQRQGLRWLIEKSPDLIETN